MTAPAFRARGLVRRFRGPRPAPFAAPTWTTALDDVDIDIDAGARVGIIGESGSGKSTLVRVLLGLDAPTAGTVEFDGRRVDARGRARQLHWLRRQTGIVFQDPYGSLDPRMSVGRIVGEPLFALGIDGDRRARVRQTLERVGLDPAMAARYPHEFSGGQRQRIAIARALLRDAPILLLDEATSALDAESERLVQDALEHLMEDRTTLVIAHRLSTVRAADRIVVMEDGRIVEQGTHQQLSSNGGLYARLASLQFGLESA